MKVKNLLIFGVTLLLFSFLFQENVLGHGLGQSFQKESGDYTIEFEYDSLEVTSDDAVPYSFRLINTEDGSVAEFDTVLVRFVEKDINTTHLVARLAEDTLVDGLARTTLLLEAGEYDVELNFQDEEAETFADATFDLTVLGGETGSQTSLPIRLLGGLAGGLVLGFLGARLMSSGSSKDDKKKK